MVGFYFDSIHKDINSLEVRNVEINQDINRTQAKYSNLEIADIQIEGDFDKFKLGLEKDLEMVSYKTVHLYLI